jgi:hypothetical protein
MKSKSDKQEQNETFEQLKNSLLNIDPIYFVEKYLTLDGSPFRIHGNGYKPYGDMYRYFGVKALEPNAKPMIVVKSRQVGNTTMASALEMYFMGSGLFGVNGKPPIRVMHIFPFGELAAAYSKTKLSQMINGSIVPEGSKPDKSGKAKSYMQLMLDDGTDQGNSLHFKQFKNGNHLWVESCGLDGDRIMGRQLSLEIDIPTPSGFIKLRDLKENDELFDENGNICRVTKLHPINFSPEAYRITFDDDTTVDACAEHLWLTHTKRDRLNTNSFKVGLTPNMPIPKIKNTKQIFETLRYGKESNHSIPNCKPLNYPEKDLPLDPYLLGLWLGDGCQAGHIESADPEIFSNYSHHVIPSSLVPRITSFSKVPSRSAAYRIDGLTNKLTLLKQLKNTHNKKGQWYNKHIPDIYMRGSFDQRLALLQGLLDTDGHVDKLGNVEFVQVRENLARQVLELVLSLGIKAKIYKRESWRYDVQYKDKYRVRFMTTLPVFRMKRKLANIKNISKKAHQRFIVDVKPIPSIPMRCITVDSSSRLYLITKQCIPTHNTADVMIFDEVQRTTDVAIGNSQKILITAKYGKPTQGLQVMFGTPRKQGSSFHKMWQTSSQQYYFLGCENCKDFFPLYTPGSDDWEKIWLHTFIVKCTKCGHEQDKRAAAERGKWIALKDDKDPDCKMVGFHINSLYMPMFSKEAILAEKPGVHPINTERVFQNEVLGEFFAGDTSPITTDEIREYCGDVGRKYRAKIDSNTEQQQIVVMGLDYGLRNDLEQLANPEKVKTTGQSYSTAVILLAKGPNLLSIEYAHKFKKNDPESKKGIIDQLMRQYNVQLAVGDIGYSNDFSVTLHNMYGDRYLVSRAHNKINAPGHIKYTQDSFPKEMIFERDFYIAELYEQMKKGMIRFPYGDYDKVGWLIEHCCSMEIKPSISRNGGDPTIHYVKGSTPNDGMMALLNAYIAYRFLVTNSFTNMNPHAQGSITNRDKPLVLGGYVEKRL